MTPHINAKKNEIAKTVLMPGDPLRAKFIAENYLSDYKLVNEIRGMLAYTGKYKGIDVTVMGHGMGNPSVGIYSYELYKFYDVQNIIRIGSCGAYKKEIKLKEIILADQAFSKTSYAYEIGLDVKNETLACSNHLLKKAQEVAQNLNLEVRTGLVVSSEAFYGSGQYVDILNEKIANEGLLAAEMEAFALYANANLLNKNALCILSVSDSIVNHEDLSADERRTSFKKMMELSLNLAVEINEN